MIKLLALDLDGTTLNSAGVVSDRNKQAIKAAEREGILVTIATGRRFRDARPVGIELELNAPLVTHNGALLKYSQTGEIVAGSILTHETALEVVEKGKFYGGDALVSVDPNGAGTLLYDRVSRDNTPLKEYLRWAEGFHGAEIGREGVVHVDLLEDALAEHDVIHISFSGTCSNMEQLRHLLGRELGASVTLLATIYPRLNFTLLDILPEAASKGHGVAELAKRVGISADEVMCIGDNYNDIEMLEFAGIGVVMGNAASDLLRRPEFYTTLSNDDNGVASAINRFIFNKEMS
ncbi:MAG: HAD family phosphatase [Acidobacteria bacterium]|nr:HAD family phosphatase [Acidobacteriota bacterium]